MCSAAAVVVPAAAGAAVETADCGKQEEKTPQGVPWREGPRAPQQWPRSHVNPEKREEHRQKETEKS